MANSDTPKKSKMVFQGSPMTEPIVVDTTEKWVRPERNKAEKYNKSGQALAHKIGKLANVKKK